MKKPHKKKRKDSIGNQISIRKDIFFDLVKYNIKCCKYFGREGDEKTGHFSIVKCAPQSFCGKNIKNSANYYDSISFGKLTNFHIIDTVPPPITNIYTCIYMCVSVCVYLMNFTFFASVPFLPRDANKTQNTKRDLFHI